MKFTKKFFKRVITTLAVIMSMVVPAFAEGIADSPIGTGIKNLLTDLSTYMIIICPSVAAVAAVYFLIRRSMADEQDGKFWMKRITISIICGIAGALVSGIIALISSYF